MNTITIQQLKDKIKQEESIKIIDVREQDEYNMGHIEDAKLYALSTLDQTYQGLNQDEEYYVICKAGGRSMKACQFLEASGYKVVNVDGGMDAWDGEIVF